MSNLVEVLQLLILGSIFLIISANEAYSVRFSPDQGCEKTCGNVSISFPFGLKVGCSRDDQSFLLKCNKTSDPPTLFFDSILSGHMVVNISLEEGQFELRSMEALQPIFRARFFENTTFVEEKTTYGWVIDKQLCEEAERDRSTFACVADHSACSDYITVEDGSNFHGYRCKCLDGYQGNPYLSKGCQGINYIKHNQTLILGIIIGGSIGIGLLLLSAGLVILRRKWKRIKQKRTREKYFHRNHGLLLQQLISSCEDSAERTKIFSLKEIEKATNHFDETRVVGRGGHGTVYKGILLDQKVVAIKKSKIVKKSEIDQFINEVAVLSQINHRNVVKLFGCCLESEVPLLVYEFISSGTLLDHLHNGNSILSWEDRLRIATEAAGALAYLHSATSMPIFHRDVKSSNILLDDHLTTKVSDFGASRFIPLDQTHLVTAVQGTFGYLDPEYYQTSQLTEKSDVYSFGVILLELLTGKKPIYCIEHDFQQNLAIHFIQMVRDNRSFELVEDCVMREATEEELVEVIQLIEMCLKLKGSKRPKMKEVEDKLQGLRRIRIQKRVNHIAIDNEGTDSLLWTFSESVDPTIQNTSMSYSLGKEIWSTHSPR